MVKTFFEQCSKSAPTKVGRRAALRQRLIELAEAAISEKGLAALRARDLARRAGCAVGSIYTAFDDLDELILRVGARTLDRLDAALQAALDADAAAGDRSMRSAEEGLVRLAVAYLDFAAANPACWRALFEHRMLDGRPVPEWFAEQLRRLFAHLDRPLARLFPDLAVGARRVLARALFSAVHGIVALGLEEKLGPITIGELRRQLAATIGAIAAGRRRLRPEAAAPARPTAPTPPPPSPRPARRGRRSI